MLQHTCEYFFLYLTLSLTFMKGAKEKIFRKLDICQELELELVTSILFFPTSTLVTSLIFVISGAMSLGSIFFSTYIIWAVIYTAALRDSTTAKFIQSIAIFALIKDIFSMLVAVTVHLLVAVANLYIFSTYELVKLFNILIFISSGSNLGFVWLISTHTVLQTISLTRFASHHFSKSLIHSVFISLGVFYFLSFSVSQPWLLYSKIPTACNSTHHNLTYPLFYVSRQSYIASTLIRGILICFPIIVKISCFGILVHYTSKDIKNEEDEEERSDELSDMHFTPGILTLFFQCIYFSVEYLHIYINANRKEKIRYDFFFIIEQLMLITMTFSIVVNFIWTDDHLSKLIYLRMHCNHHFLSFFISRTSAFKFSYHCANTSFHWRDGRLTIHIGVLNRKLTDSSPTYTFTLIHGSSHKV